MALAPAEEESAVVVFSGPTMGTRYTVRVVAPPLNDDARDERGFLGPRYKIPRKDKKAKKSRKKKKEEIDYRNLPPLRKEERSPTPPLSEEVNITLKPVFIGALDARISVDVSWVPGPMEMRVQPIRFDSLLASNLATDSVTAPFPPSKDTRLVAPDEVTVTLPSATVVLVTLEYGGVA